MKKTISMIVAALIVLSSLVVLASCGGGGGIVGKWAATIEYDKFAGSDGANELAQYGIDLSGKTIDLNIEFKSDGKYEASVNMEDILDAIRDPMKEMLDSMISAYGMDLDEYIGQMGYESFDQYLEAMIGEGESGTGEYKYENGELTVDGSVIKAEVSGNDLTFTEIVSSADEGFSIPEGLLPLTFKRK